MKQNPKGYEGDLAFMDWIKTASNAELQAQYTYAVDWQKVAIEREIERRHKR